ncbi:MAG: carboxypeptidase-like regulatory domain-containing protein [Acidobacteriota bacterium]
MRRAVLLTVAMLAPVLRGGVVHGVVLEHTSGLALARAKVSLEVLSDFQLKPFAAILSGRRGEFVFPSVPPGYYVLSAVRGGFAKATYGQKRSNGPGFPIPVTADSEIFIELRLRRLGAISGRVLDENRVGLPDISVLAYPVALPLRIAAEAKTDDRGIFRIPGLRPGRYFVRSGAHELADKQGLAPTYAPETALTRDAKIVKGDLDYEEMDVNLHPLPGRLFRLSGFVKNCREWHSATVTLSSDTGRRQTKVQCGGRYTFENLAPGDYELLGEHQSEENKIPLNLSAHLELFLDSTNDSVHVELRDTPVVAFGVDRRDTSGLRLDRAAVQIRRKDLAGESEPRPAEPKMRLQPGYWELTAAPPPSHYFKDVDAPGWRRRSKAGQHPDWYEFYIEPRWGGSVGVSFSSRPATLAGVVALRKKPVCGAPVFLFPVTAETRRRMNGMKTAFTDAEGRYQFEGLAPGRYLVLSSFDFGEIGEEILVDANAPSVLLEDGQAGALDLTLYEAP